MRIVLSNPEHPEYGMATIPIPIPRKEYDSCMEILQTMEIGDAVLRDCKVEQFSTGWQVLDSLNGQLVNIDELDYLMKRLESFFGDEDSKFLAAASARGLTDVKDLINLTFCSYKTTVVTDFSNLEKIGKEHAMDLNGGSMVSEEYKQLDGRSIALELLHSGKGKITPYGVLYENGMELEELYTGSSFPPYLYERSLLVVDVFPKEHKDIKAMLALPMSEKQIDGALIRAGISLEDVMEYRIEDCWLPDGVLELITPEVELGELNELCDALADYDDSFLEKLGAVISFVKPLGIKQVTELVHNLDDFDYIPNINTPEELGRYYIRESNRFLYDDHLDGYYDYARYGENRIKEHEGAFVEKGYVEYCGENSLDEIFSEEETESQDMEMRV